MEAEKEKSVPGGDCRTGILENLGGDPLTLPDCVREVPLDFPYGVLRCTCEKYPKAFYANEQMLAFLGTTRESEDWRELIRQNIFFMVPFEERHVLRRDLDLASQTAEPVSVEHRVRNCSGGYTSLIGWLRTAVNEEGNTEYCFMYMRMPEALTALRQEREQAYQNALKDVYDVMFQIDLAQRTIECIHRKPEAQVRCLSFVRMMLDDVIRLGLSDHIYEEDRAAVQDFFHRIADPARGQPEDGPLQILFRVLWDGESETCLANATRLDDKTILLCCRDTTREEYIRRLAGEDGSLCAARECADEQDASAPALSARPRVFIRTFGYFDVFVDGKPIVFRYEKSKEMLAVLVDRCGSFVTNPYIISCIWEDEPYGEKVQGRCRQTAYRMMETLKKYGIADIIERVDGRRRIVPELVECDYFDYKDGKEGARRQFNGTYMADYSWGEVTLSSLLKEKPT